MIVWFSADWHVFHDRIIRYCRRPFRHVQQMHDALIANYCEVVGPEDEVYFLGDFTLRGPSLIRGVQKIAKRLPGRKHFILGNHDRLRPHSYLRMGFASVHTSLDLIQDGVRYCLVHDPVDAPNGTERLLCGHVHDNWRVRNQPCPTVNVGVDVWDFRPVAFDVAVEGLDRL